MSELANLNALSDEEFVAKLGAIYEHSEWVAVEALRQRPFPSCELLSSCMRQVVDDASDAMKLELIRAHPDLAGKLARAGYLTDASTREQVGLGLDRLTDEEYRNFSELNNRYGERFGFPFVVCARRTTKRGVLEAFEERLKNSREVEISEAIAQIHEIARLRLEDLMVLEGKVSTLRT